LAAGGWRLGGETRFDDSRIRDSGLATSDDGLTGQPEAEREAPCESADV
jgi:hypothetical protein